MDWWKQLDKQVADYLPELKIVCDEPMSSHTSFRIGGPAKRMAFPQNGEQMVLLLNFARDCGANPLVIGNGSNLLVADDGLERLVIETSGMKQVRLWEKPNTILAEAGATLARVATFACEQGLAGLEFAHGIPGTVGGAVCMNAGAYDGEMKQVLLGASVLFPEPKPTPAAMPSGRLWIAMAVTNSRTLLRVWVCPGWLSCSFPVSWCR